MRELLNERAAWMPTEWLCATAFQVGVDAAPLDLVAEVLAEIHERAIGRLPYAAIYFGELARRGLGGLRQVEAFEHPDALEALAVVLAAHHGHLMRLLDGEPLSSRS